jgi:hypothetical protein
MPVNPIRGGGVGGPSAQHAVHFEGLLATNPKLADQLKTHPGLKKLLDDNKDAISRQVAPAAGQVRAEMTDVTWTHTTSIVPPKVRDEEFIFVVAQGSAYKGNVNLPLTDGKKVEMDGQIVFVGRTGDFPWQSEVDRANKATDPKDKAERLKEERSYPGSGYSTIQYPLYGKPGEDVTISYVRFNPTQDGKVNPREAAWAPTSKGPVFNTGYEERTTTFKLEKARFTRDDGEISKG